MLDAFSYCAETNCKVVDKLIILYFLFWQNIIFVFQWCKKLWELYCDHTVTGNSWLGIKQTRNEVQAR